MLADEAVEFRVRLPPAGPSRRDVRTNALQHEHAEEDEHGHHRADPPILAEQQHQDAQRQQNIARQMNDEAGEKVRKRIHVAVHPFDQRTGRLLLVERHIERQAVLGQIRAQPVGRGPPKILAVVRRNDGHGLLHERERDEQSGCDIERPETALTLGGIDKVTNNLRIHQLQSDRGRQQQGKPNKQPAIGQHVSLHHLAVAADRSLRFIRARLWLRFLSHADPVHSSVYILPALSR
jgi:hypothetical protein